MSQPLSKQTSSQSHLPVLSISAGTTEKCTALNYLQGITDVERVAVFKDDKDLAETLKALQFVYVKHEDLPRDLVSYLVEVTGEQIKADWRLTACELVWGPNSFHTTYPSKFWIICEEIDEVTNQRQSYLFIQIKIYNMRVVSVFNYLKCSSSSIFS